MAKNFAELAQQAQQAQQGWNAEARAAYDAASTAFTEHAATEIDSKGSES